jgi:zinc/manganese transport system substrate-binding protein
MKILKFALAACACVLPGMAAALNVLACEPEWAALTQELGGEQVKVVSATTARQDPHRIEARPSLLAKARNADLLVCTGAELEAGWLPVLQQQSGNSRIQAGRSGYFEAAAHVTMLEVPERVDRSMGDVHAQGNPHIHLDPRNIARVAEALSQRLQQLDRQHAAYYQQRHADFQARWQQAMDKWRKQAAGLHGQPIAVQHKDLTYLSAWLGMRETLVLEPKPGIDPSIAHLSTILERVRQQPVKAVVYAAYQSPRASQWFARKANVPAVEIPFTVGGAEGADDLFGLFDLTVQRLADAIQ